KASAFVLIASVSGCGGNVEAPDIDDSVDIVDIPDEPLLVLTPQRFPDTEVGSVSSIAVTVSNSSRKRAFTITQVTVNPPFFVDPLASPLRLAPRQTTTIPVSFEPTTVGTFTGQLRCQIERKSTPQIISLTGTAVAPAPTDPPPAAMPDVIVT